MPWIKGIRQMTVIYYYCPSTEAISELIEAGQVMGVDVRPGIEVTARLRGKYVQLIWVLRGLHSAREHADFLERAETRAFLDEGRKAVEYNTNAVLDLLRSVNDNHLPRLRAEYALDLPPLDAERFVHFVGVGQPSRAHLVEFLHQGLVAEVQAKLPAWREEWQKAAGAERRAIEERVQRLDAITTQDLASTVLSAAANPDVVDVHIPHDDPSVPDCLRQAPVDLVRRLRQLRVGSAVTLNPSNLTAAEVLEILYDGKAGVTDLEIFNLKDYHQKRNPQTREIAQIVQILNDGNPITCKRMIEELIRDIEKSDEEAAAKADRLSKMRHILGDMQSLLSLYAKTPLGTRVGSDSVGRAHGLSGMGLAVMATLPARAQREFRRRPGTREVIPIATETALVTTWIPRHSHIRVLDVALRFLRRFPGLRELGFDCKEQHQVLPSATVMAAKGNVITLGGTPEARGNGFSLAPREEANSRPELRWRSLSTGVRDILKVLLGLIPAFVSFRLTKHWWLLAYFGAFIWFGVTGLRNVLQSIVGGGGIVRSELLKWRDLVRWGRVADSLLYTGFSVPLLDWLVKSVILRRGLGVTTATAPLLLYSVMALANGDVPLLPQHVPRTAARRGVRQLLPVDTLHSRRIRVQRRPVSGAPGEPDTTRLPRTSRWSPGPPSSARWRPTPSPPSSRGPPTATSTSASGSVTTRTRLASCSRSTVGSRRCSPPSTWSSRSPRPRSSSGPSARRRSDLETHQIINALDLMYFWMYQPRARLVFEEQLAALEPGGAADHPAHAAAPRAQAARQRDVPARSGGEEFSPPLAFYLDNMAAYLHDMRLLAAKYHVQWDKPKGGTTRRPLPELTSPTRLSRVPPRPR